ncbi:hypothetical protein B0O80DRAFT_278523 [Mortierella sp. GBAus27b]|nr:hypothetical protein BGX31_004448 [Mortierella sp. GBA43]KAI8358324.1 hypothetical protein B0O80DRAFT_278523 [Mortierella sp. GBAus27b]
MAYLTSDSILAIMGPTCTTSEMLSYNGNQFPDGTGVYIGDSDSESSYSGSSGTFSTGSINGPDGVILQGQGISPQQAGGQQITYHYFCNFPTCDYHSARSDPVKRHRDTHYPDYKPYTCNYCNSSSARRDSTREHCLKQHNDDSESAFRYDTTIPKPEGWIAYEPKRAPWPPIMV